MFERAVRMAKAISDGEIIGHPDIPFGARERQRSLAHAVLGLQARVEQLEEQNEKLRLPDTNSVPIADGGDWDDFR